jgi:hypothetical protein
VDTEEEEAEAVDTAEGVTAAVVVVVVVVDEAVGTAAVEVATMGTVRVEVQVQVPERVDKLGEPPGGPADVCEQRNGTASDADLERAVGRGVEWSGVESVAGRKERSAKQGRKGLRIRRREKGTRERSSGGQLGKGKRKNPRHIECTLDGLALHD